MYALHSFYVYDENKAAAASIEIFQRTKSEDKFVSVLQQNNGTNF